MTEEMRVEEAEGQESRPALDREGRPLLREGVFRHWSQKAPGVGRGLKGKWLTSLVQGVRRKPARSKDGTSQVPARTSAVSPEITKPQRAF